MLIVSDMVTLYFTDFQPKKVFKKTKKKKKNLYMLVMGLYTNMNLNKY